jgi:diguanylate cyclase (GGDEF)-like protein/PAS domain S-box-containing protein
MGRAWLYAAPLQMADAARTLTEAKRLLRVQQSIAGHIAGARSRAELLQRVLATIGGSLEWTFGAAWGRDFDDRLRCRATWQRKGAGVAEFERETRSHAFARGESLSGRTWAYGEPVWLPDVAGERCLPRREAAVRAGLACGVAFPLAAGDRFDGALEFFSAEIREPDADLLAMFAAVGSHLAQALERWDAIVALADSEELNRSVVSALQEGVLVFSAAGRIVAANAAAGRILGLPREAIVGGSPRELVGSGIELLLPDGSPVTAESSAALEALRQGQAQRDVVLRIVRPDGSMGWVSLTAQPLKHPRDPPHGVVCSLEDITERRAAELALRDERDRAQRYLDVTTTMIVVLDAQERIELLNPKCAEVLGRPEERLVGRNWFDLAVPERERERTREAFHRLLAGEVELVECYENPVVTRDGQERTIAWHNAVVRVGDGQVTGTISSGEDVTERRAVEREMTHLAYHDRLTGLPNRTLLEQHLAVALARAVRQGHGVALLFLDLDDFKLVNDSFGHAAGDNLLREVAARLRAVTRASDLLARQGGDEFLLLLSDLGEDADSVAGAVADKLEAALEPPHSVGGAEFYVSASIGISLYPGDAESAAALMRHADAAMYQAKADGRARVRRYPSDDPKLETDSIIERLSIPTRLRRAIEHDELVLHYQPMVRLADAQVVGMEALVRWQDPERGLIAPAQFIPHAEESGLIAALGDWVLAAVLRQAGEWAQQGLRPRLAFNLSPHQLRHPGLVDSVRERLGASELEPSRLSAEITESAAMVEAGAGAPTLNELAALGITLAVDDFGAGYSSLARLRGLPIEILKIDRSFLAAVPGDREARALLSSIVHMAGALGKVPIAEGVETPEQHRFLLELGCPLAQGFLLAHPMDAERATEHLRGGLRLAPA